MTNDVAERLKRAISELGETSLERDALAEIERLTEAVADKESDCARLHSALMDAKYPETAPVEPEGSRRGIEVMATHAQQAWYHVGQLAIVRPEMTVEKAVQEVYKLCTGESSPERCGCGEFIERRCGVCGEPWLPVNRGAEPDVR